MVTTTTRPTLLRRLAGLAICFTVVGLAGCGDKTQPPVRDNAEIYLKTDAEERLIPATKDGKPWPRCPPEKCGVEQVPDIPDVEKFSLVLIERKVPPKGPGQTDSKARAAGLINTAHADDDNGRCTIIWVHYPDFGWVPFWNPDDPNCPP